MLRAIQHAAATAGVIVQKFFNFVNTSVNSFDVLDDNTVSDSSDPVFVPRFGIKDAVTDSAYSKIVTFTDTGAGVSIYDTSTLTRQNIGPDFYTPNNLGGYPAIYNNAGTVAVIPRLSTPQLLIYDTATWQLIVPADAGTPWAGVTLPVIVSPVDNQQDPNWDPPVY